MLPAGFDGDGRFGTLIFESYGAAACDNEIPREDDSLQPSWFPIVLVKKY